MTWVLRRPIALTVLTARIARSALDVIPSIAAKERWIVPISIVLFATTVVVITALTVIFQSIATA